MQFTQTEVQGAVQQTAGYFGRSEKPIIGKRWTDECRSYYRKQGQAKARCVTSVWWRHSTGPLSDLLSSDEGMAAGSGTSLGEGTTKLLKENAIRLLTGFSAHHHHRRCHHHHLGITMNNNNIINVTIIINVIHYYCHYHHYSKHSLIHCLWWILVEIIISSNTQKSH